MNDPHPPPAAPPPGWHVPGPAHIPQMTIWPVTVAFGSMLLLWGILTTALLSAVGGVLLACAVIGWVGDIRNDRRRQN